VQKCAFSFFYLLINKDFWKIKCQSQEKDAVGHSLTSEKTVIEVAQDLGIAHSNLRRWRAQYRQKRGTGLPREW
jgi:hypothetical protein